MQEAEGVAETELGYHVRHDLWGQGLVTTSMLSLFLTSEAMDEPSYGKITASHILDHLNALWKSFNHITSLLAESMHSSLVKLSQGVTTSTRLQNRT